MHELLTKTGPYLHAPDDLLRITFETGGTPRVFTVLAASAVERDEIDRDGAGLVILDEDEGRVLLDRHRSVSSGAEAGELYRISSLCWGEFSDFCRSHPRFRGGPEDIVTPHEAPLPGSRRRHSSRSDILREARSSGSGDLRSALMIRADADPDCSVRFPPRDRSGVLEDLRGRITRVYEDGSYRLGWPLQAPTAPDLSGLNGRVSVDRSLDLAWEERVEQRPELKHEAWWGVMEMFGSGRTSTFGAADEGRYDMRISSDEANGHLVLFALDEVPLSDRSEADLSTKLSDLPDRTIRDLWKLSRTLDHELSENRVSALFEVELNRIRAETETSQDSDPSPSGP